jgi:hypothetical protein
MTTNDVKNVKFNMKNIFNIWSVPKASLLPAFVLVTLVLFTYATLQSYGPESTLRKFHTAMHNIVQSQNNQKRITKKDWEALRETLDEDIGNWNQNQYIANNDAFKVIKRVLEQFQEGKAYSLARMDRYSREVRIAVLYQKNKMPPTSMVWIVDKPFGGREWKISARKTLSTMTVP